MYFPPILVYEVQCEVGYSLFSLCSLFLIWFCLTDSQWWRILLIGENPNGITLLVMGEVPKLEFRRENWDVVNCRYASLFCEGIVNLNTYHFVCMPFVAILVVICYLFSYEMDGSGAGPFCSAGFYPFQYLFSFSISDCYCFDFLLQFSCSDGEKSISFQIPHNSSALVCSALIMWLNVLENSTYWKYYYFLHVRLDTSIVIDYCYLSLYPKNVVIQECFTASPGHYYWRRGWGKRKISV